MTLRLALSALFFIGSLNFAVAETASFNTSYVAPIFAQAAEAPQGGGGVDTHNLSKNIGGIAVIILIVVIAILYSKKKGKKE